MLERAYPWLKIGVLAGFLTGCAPSPYVVETPRPGQVCFDSFLPLEKFAPGYGIGWRAFYPEKRLGVQYRPIDESQKLVFQEHDEITLPGKGPREEVETGVEIFSCFLENGERIPVLTYTIISPGPPVMTSRRFYWLLLGEEQPDLETSVVKLWARWGDWEKEYYLKIGLMESTKESSQASFEVILMEPILEDEF